MKYFLEPVTNGVVETRSPLYLTHGELTASSYSYYTAQSDLLEKVPAFASALASASAITGLERIIFGSAEYLITHGNGAYYRAPVTAATGAVGTWAAVATGMTVTALPDTFNVVQQNNKYVLMDGLNTNKVLRSDGTTRRLGLTPVKKVIAVASASASANVWPGNSIGYFDYWYTEVAEYGASPEDIIIESSYEATVSADVTGAPAISTVNAQGTDGRGLRIGVATIYVPALNTEVTLTLDAQPTNPTATHYYIYRSEAKDFANVPVFPIGKLIAKVKVTSGSGDVITVKDGGATTSGYFYPATYDSAPSGTWTNPANVASDNATEYADGTYATGKAQAEVIVKALSVSGITDPISGIKIEARARQEGGGAGSRVLYVTPSFNNGASWGYTVQMPVTYDGSWSNCGTAGFQTFGRTNLTTDDVSNGNLLLKFKVGGPTAGASGLDIDGVRVSFQHNASQNIPTTPYPGIVLNIGQDQFVTSKGGEPPIASVGCMYQGSLVTNDVNNTNIVRWSIPGELDAFPALYFFPVNAPFGSSKITFLGIVNNVCVVGMEGAIVRINYLPTENDSNFTRDTIYDYIATDVGIVNSRAARVYRNADGREVLAVVTQTGVHITDGFTLHKVDDDLDFAQIISELGSNTYYSAQRIWLASELHTQNLMLVYRGNGNATIVRPLNWAPQHAKPGGKLKLGGHWYTGVNYGSMISFVTTSGLPVVYALKNDSTVWLAQPSGTVSIAGAWSVNTRMIVPSSPPSEFDVHQIYMYGRENSMVNCRVTGRAYRTFKAVTSKQSNVSTSTYEITKVELGLSGEFMQFTITCTSLTEETALGHIVIEYDDQLHTESDE